MDEISKPHEEVKELTEKELDHILRKKYALKPEEINYIVDAISLLTIAESYRELGFLHSDLVFEIIATAITNHNNIQLIKYFAPDVINIISKILNKLPHQINPLYYLQNYYFNKIIKLPNLRHSFKNNHILLERYSTDMIDESESPESKTKIIIYRTPAKKKHYRKRINKRTL